VGHREDEEKKIMVGKPEGKKSVVRLRHRQKVTLNRILWK
jgi:hypothetical protein